MANPDLVHASAPCRGKRDRRHGLDDRPRASKEVPGLAGQKRPALSALARKTWRPACPRRLCIAPLPGKTWR